MKTLAIIPARKGSKGIPGKNKRIFMGKPLCAWAIECGLRTCNRVVVSSDDPDILDIAESYGVEPIVRPDDLAQDDTPMLDVLRHVLAVDQRKNDVIVLLQPTQPLREDARIKQALCLLNVRKWYDSVVSILQIPPHMSPDYSCRIDSGLLSLPVKTRRQDCQPAYFRDGTVYVFRDSLLRRGQMYGRAVPLLIPDDESCPIDTEDDWKRAEEMWRRRNARREQEKAASKNQGVLQGRV